MRKMLVATQLYTVVAKMNLVQLFCSGLKMNTLFCNSVMTFSIDDIFHAKMCIEPNSVIWKRKFVLLTVLKWEEIKATSLLWRKFNIILISFFYNLQQVLSTCNRPTRTGYGYLNVTLIIWSGKVHFRRRRCEIFLIFCFEVKARIKSFRTAALRHMRLAIDL